MKTTALQPDVLHFADDASRDLVASLGLSDFRVWLDNSRIEVWRDIRERQNATLDLEDGIRLHVKRLRPPTGREVIDEVRGVRLLESAGIPSVPLVTWGQGSDGSGLLVTRDLEGFKPADRLLAEGRSFSSLRDLTAEVAGRLHGANLHHRDLYLCHFLLRDEEIRLIDAARVRPMPWLTRKRWIVKDLAQFRFSGMEAGVSEEELDEWLRRWADQVGASADGWRDAVRRKAQRIAKHDAKLRRRQPGRHVQLDQ